MLNHLAIHKTKRRCCFGISPKTVSIHKRSAMRKLNIDNNIEFLRWLKMHSDLLIRERTRTVRRRIISGAGAVIFIDFRPAWNRFYRR